MITEEQRLRRLYHLDSSTGCLIWDGAVNHAGYGHFRASSGKTVRIHRYLYEKQYGLLSEKLVLDHTCGRRNCIELSHLEPVTQLENVRRGKRATLIHHNTKKTHCIRGHKLTGTNISVSKDGHRRCKVCRRKGVRP